MRKKTGRYGKYGETKRKERLKVHVEDGRDLIKKEKRRKIAPGHPNTGRR